MTITELGEATDVNDLIEEHLPLVKHVVFQVATHFPRHVEREELVRAGSLGLVEAARRYDPDLGVPFNRYAAQRIRGAILDSVRAADWAPRSTRARGREIDKTEQRLAAELGRTPEVHETAAELGMTMAELAKIRSRIHRSVVLTLDKDHHRAHQGEDVSIADMLTDQRELEPSEELERREMLSYLRDAVSLLPERHRLVVTGYFFEGRTSAELARFLGVTESRISQIRSEALDMLKDGITAQFRDDDPHTDVKGRAARRRAEFADAIGDASDFHGRLGEPATLAAALTL